MEGLVRLELEVATEGSETGSPSDTGRPCAGEVLDDGPPDRLLSPDGERPEVRLILARRFLNQN